MCILYFYFPLVWKKILFSQKYIWKSAESMKVKDNIDTKFTMFLGIKCYINQSELYMNKPHSKNLQNIDTINTVKFGVCKCCWSGEKTL